SVHRRGRRLTGCTYRSGAHRRDLRWSGRSERSLDLGKSTAQRALPLRLGPQIQALPRRIGVRLLVERSLLRPQHKLVAVGILENRVGAPLLALGWTGKLHAAFAQLTVRGFDVVTSERAVEERADAVLVAFGRKKDDPRFARADGKLDPALIAERLVGEDAKAHLLRPEFECALLVAHRNAGKFQMCDHDNGASSLRGLTIVQPFRPAQAAEFLL